MHKVLEGQTMFHLDVHWFVIFSFYFCCALYELSELTFKQEFVKVLN